jgi:hypothetical protein
MARLPESHITEQPAIPLPSPAEAPSAPPPESARRGAEQAARVMSRLDLVLAAVVLALAFMVASFKVQNSDFFQHAATGRYIAHGRTDVLLGDDPFSFATAGRHWVNNAWFFDVIVYALYMASPSGAAVVVFKAVIVMLLAAFTMLACRPPASQQIPLGSKPDPTGWLAALLTGVGIVALSFRLLMQPTVLSMLFTAITFWLLTRDREGKGLVRFTLPIAGLFLLWVNCDSWFILGPLLVLLFLIGEVVQRFFPGADARPASPERIKMLAVSLVAGLAACLINPHHFYVFTVLPAELSSYKLSAELLRENYYGLQFLQPISSLYLKDAQFGNNVIGYCYGALLALGIASFALNLAHVRWAQVLTWIAFAGLSIYNFRLIPFFAVVSVPITVLNVHAWFARRPEWADEAPALDSPAAPGNITLTPVKLAAIGGLTGRLLTLLLGVFTLLVAYPGGLAPAGAAGLRRVAWTVRPDPAIQDVAEKLQALHESGRMPKEARGMALRPEIANYCAWFAPSEKGFFDQRYPLLGDLSKDLGWVRRGMHGQSGGDEWESVLERRRITHMVFGASSFVRDDTADQVLPAWADESHWSLWFQNGQTAIFGWHDPPLEIPSADPLRVDVVKEAFGPAPALLKAPALTATPTDADRARDFLERALAPPPAPDPYERKAAFLYDGMRQVTIQKANVRSLIAYPMGDLSAPVAQPVTFTLELLRADGERARLCQRTLVNQSEEAAALGLLAVRSARRAIAAAPDQAMPYLTLFMVYKAFPEAGIQLRVVQMQGILRQGLARVTAEDLDNANIAGLITYAYLSLTQLHLAAGQWDLATECLERALKLYPKAPPATIPKERLEQLYKEEERQLEVLKDRELPRRREAFELQSAKKPPFVQAVIAANYGLHREALKILISNKSDLNLDGVLALASLYLCAGQVAEAEMALSAIQESDLQNPQAFDQRVAYREWRKQAAVQAGDFAAAGKILDEMIADRQREFSDPISNKARAMAVGTLLFSDTLGFTPLLRITPIVSPQGNSVLFRLSRLTIDIANLHAWRGMLALEEGDTVTAVAHLLESIDPYLSVPVALNGAGNMHFYLSILKKQNPSAYEELVKKRAGNRGQ